MTQSQSAQRGDRPVVPWPVWQLLTLGLSMVLAGGCGPDAAPANSAQGGGDRGGPGGPGRGRPQITPVEVQVARTGSITRTVTVSGVVEPLRSVGVNAQMAGALVSVQVEEGRQVRAGQLLAQLDAREITAQVRSAEANLELARSSAERAERLWQQQMITVQEYERDRAALVAAQAQADQLRTRLGYATIRAPIQGVITEKRVEAGDVVGSLTRLFTIADLSTLVVPVPVSELEVAHLNQGTRVGVSVDALPGRVVRGRVRRVFPSADPVTRLVPVEVALDPADARGIRPGFLARVTFSTAEGGDALLVPAVAVVGAAGPDPAVFLVRADTAWRVSVRLGAAAEGRVELLDGVRPGDSVVVAGNVGLRDAGPIRIVPPVAVAESAPTGLRGT